MVTIRHGQASVSSYASRGLKMRYLRLPARSSGTRREQIICYTSPRARCIYITKARGRSGLQNGSVKLYRRTVCRAVRRQIADSGENLICSSLDLECASVTTGTFTHSDMRRTARLLMQFLPGTPTLSPLGIRGAELRQHMFAGSNEDAEDF